MNSVPHDVVTRLDLLTVLEAVANGVSIADAEGRIVYSNAAANRILGTPATDQPPEEWADYYGVFVPNSDQPFPAEDYPLIRALAGEEVTEREMVIRNPSLPHEVTISSSSRPLRAENGSITGAIVIFRDVTKLRHTQRALERTNVELRETQRLKDELAGFVLHDIKNPLTTIMFLAEVLSEGRSDPEAVRSDLNDIRGAAARIHRMTLDLLDIQLAEDGGLRLEPEDIQVGDLLDEVRRAVRGRARGIRVAEPPPGRAIVGDRALLSRVLINLVDNCVKYGPDGGQITIQAAAQGDQALRITVQDEGPGVPKDLREKIFEKYAQVERTEQHRSTDSRGLGLRFCKVIVEAHRGRIWVEDGAPKGACFCVELPIPIG